MIRKKEKKEKLPLYKGCERCESTSYLTISKTYICNSCKHKEPVYVDDKCFQELIKEFVEGEESE